METNTGNLRPLIDQLRAKEIAVENKNLPRRVRNELRLTGKSKIGRNAQCPCGSGRKFKHCHYTEE